MYVFGFKHLMRERYFGNTVGEYLTCLGTFLLFLALLYVFKRIFLARLKQWAEKTSTGFDDVLVQAVEQKLLPLLYAGAFYLSLRGLTLAPGLDRFLHGAWWVALVAFGVRFSTTLLQYALTNAWIKDEADSGRRLAISGMVTLLKVVLWGFASIMLLDNLGVKISALVAGLGIGGVAIALASQAVLGDLFSFFVIFFDRPFGIGDFIVAGDVQGEVERIGIKSTRMKSVTGEQLIVSNKDLTSARIRNFKRMERRRAVFKWVVAPQTPVAVLRELPPLVELILKAFPDTAVDHVHFMSIGDAGPAFEAAYFVKGNDYNRYLDIQQEINLKVAELFQKRSIEFTRPAQVVLVNKPS